MIKHSDKKHHLTDNVPRVISRRHFLKSVGFTAAGLSVHAGCNLFSNSIRFGMVTDAHYADRDYSGTRYYRESAAKMRECVEQMNKEDVSFLVELGDFKDQDNPPTEESTLAYLQSIEGEFQKFKGNKYHVLGNHDVDSISKEQFLAVATNTHIPRESTYYSFDSKGHHFIILDANYRSDGLDYDSGNYDWTDANIPPKELTWLETRSCFYIKTVDCFCPSIT